MTREEYDKACDEASIFAGPCDHLWNTRYVIALARRGLAIVEHDPFKAGDSVSCMAPMPLDQGWKYPYPSWITPIVQPPC